MWPTGGRQRHQKLPNKEVTKIHVGCGSMLKFVIHWKHLLHFFLNDANNSASHPQWNSLWGNETDTKRRGQKECIKFNSIVSLEKDNLLASCHPPPNVLCGIMIVTNQKNKACIIASCNAHRYKYKIHVRCFCTLHIYMAHVWGALGLSTCSRFGTFESSDIYTWSERGKNVCLKNTGRTWQLSGVTAIFFESFLYPLLHVIFKLVNPKEIIYFK